MLKRPLRSAVLVSSLLPLAASCDAAIPPAPSAPTPTAVTRTITGTLWVHSAGGGVEPGRGRTVVPVLETQQGWSVQNPITLDNEGRYTLTALAAMRLLIGARDYYQPCAATVEPGGDATIDLHIVEDVARLGSNLPAALQGRPPTLSGRVFELTPAGEVPVVGARVTVTDGDFTTVASTLSDASGRYVLCGVPQSSRLSLVAEGPGYLSDVVPGLAGRTQLDIALRRP